MPIRAWTWILVAALAVLCVACSAPEDETWDEGPPAPSMPAGWTVEIDMSFPPHEVAKISRNLGGEVASLRNTTYLVNGKKVQMNTIVAVDQTNADRIMNRVRDMKPDDFILQHGVVIYEFVCDNDAVPEMRQGKAHLDRGAD